MFRNATLAIAAVGLSACASQSTRDAASNGPPEDYREKVAAHVREIFIDPYSIRDAAIAAPMRKTGRMYWNPIDPPADWYVCIRANGKNRSGVYAGLQENIILFREGNIVGAHTKPTDPGSSEATVSHLCAGAQYAPFPEIEGTS